MAEAAVGWAINKLDTLLTGEVKLLRNVHTELQGLRDELEAIESFLRDADVRFYQENSDSRIKTWVKQVRQVAFEIEDAIDVYMLHLVRHQDQHGFFHKISRLVRKLKPRHEIASKIQDLKKSVCEIRERSDRYKFNLSSEQGSSDRDNTWHDPRVHSLFIDEAELVGIESPKAELISKLVEGASENVVISVVGMGGLGKTTLAKKVFDSERVTVYFDCKAWITVTQSYKMAKLLRIMIRQLHQENVLPAFEGTDTMSELSLIEKLREYLIEKRYLVIFDDVWDIFLWGYIMTALPNNGKGNRIIITTRNEGVAPSPNESPFYYVFKLQLLPKREAYELFCKKVFQSNGGNCPSQLQELSHAIVEKCEGLPLAIVTIGGVLATKEKLVTEWKKFYDDLTSSLASDQRLSNIIKILSLSYQDLPYYLKSCFLYFNLFPENCSINCWRLIRLWIADGLIKERQGRIVEEVAEEYLIELVHRRLVQVERVSFDSKARECRVHDLMREIILFQSRELSFHQVSSKDYQNLKGRSRHLSINDKVKNILESNCNSQTHSIILFESNELPKSFITSVIDDFKLLRSLDLEGAPLDYIPDEVGNLWHLKYLCLKDTNVKVLPKSIGKLCNLETLDLRQSLVLDLPIEINRLLKLRHLLAYFFNYDNEFYINSLRAVKMHGNIGSLKALQKLSYIEADHGVDLIRQIERLTQLRKLGITKLKKENGLDLCYALEKMSCLQTLKVSSGSVEEFLDLRSISGPPLLQYLYLSGPLVELPPWISKLSCLVKLVFNWSRLGNDAIQVLQALPNLQMLRFYEGCNAKQLHFTKGCFSNLKMLHLLHLTRLNKLIIDEGGLPVIEELSIGPCPKLKELPSGIHYLRNLKRLEFYDIQREFAIGMQPLGGHEYCKVQNIPLILFYYKFKGYTFNQYKLGNINLLKRLMEVSE
ncbi:Disease resistance protein RPM1, putative [Ricinus communis]|uniref:Disease resistance protein RPM1, putative n=1 Tax=Ricinus communis TaxID=3988 RepID=B9T1X5_RICCO|nr:Disease resistance protein RPM1, putative [Ricinus communis]|eukprot:XP_002532244.1 disease resistance protein RPM1 [Ricinus communis]